MANDIVTLPNKLSFAITGGVDKSIVSVGNDAPEIGFGEHEHCIIK